MNVMSCQGLRLLLVLGQVLIRLTYILSDVRFNIMPIWFLGQKNASKVWVESKRFVHLVFSQLPMPWNHPKLPQRWIHSAFITGICLMRLTTSTTHTPHSPQAPHTLDLPGKKVPGLPLSSFSHIYTKIQKAMHFTRVGRENLRTTKPTSRVSFFYQQSPTY